MDFAKKQLEKYGWTEGQGLGKSNNGISTPLKPKLKFDNAGIGHSHAKDLVNDWWTNVYKSASDNIEVTNDSNDVQIGMKGDESIDISTKGYTKILKNNNVSLEYGSFIKTAQINASGTKKYDVPEHLCVDKPKINVLSDEELFAACAGRTAHKGARHGLKLSGKLDRLAKHEQMLLKKFQNVSLNDEKCEIEKKMKKLLKNKKCTDDNPTILNLEDHSKTSTASTKKKHKEKKKKKERKNVSFNETVTVTEYLAPDLESSRLSSDSNDNSFIACSEQNLNDEGIEQDLDAFNNTIEDQNSFEEPQCVEEKLSKAEHRLKKKNRATHRFLRRLQLEDEEVVSDSKGIENTVLCAKRKLADGEYSEGNVRKKKKKVKLGKETKEERKKRKGEKKSLINSITKSLDSLCYISDDS
nr:G patch domain-containing protein 4 [Onthophagus taurus]